MENKWLSDEKLHECENRLKAQGFSDFCDTVRACAQAREANRLREALENLKSILDGQIESGDVYPRILRHHVLELLEGEK